MRVFELVIHWQLKVAYFTWINLGKSTLDKVRNLDHIHLDCFDYCWSQIFRKVHELVIFDLLENEGGQAELNVFGLFFIRWFVL